jgi:recombination protein RecT
MSTEIAIPKNTTELIHFQEMAFNDLAVDEKITFKKEAAFACQLLAANDFLNGVAWQNQPSLINAIHNVASIGISLNPASKHAYLVPRKGVVNLDISYKGMLHLAISTGSILWGQCKLVRESHEFRLEAIDKAPLHKYDPFSKEQGEILGGYCTVKLHNGDFMTEVMSIDEILEIAKKSPSFAKASAPWKMFYSEMCRKTVVKRASKYWPHVERLDAAIHYVDTTGGEGIPFTKSTAGPAEILDDDPIAALLELTKDKDQAKVLKWLGVDDISELTIEAAQAATTKIRNSQ